MKQVEWGDIQQAAEGIFIVARASTMKNHKSQRQYMPVWFFAELAKAKPQDVAGNTRVLWGVNNAYSSFEFIGCIVFNLIGALAFGALMAPTLSRLLGSRTAVPL